MSSIFTRHGRFLLLFRQCVLNLTTQPARQRNNHQQVANDGSRLASLASNQHQRKKKPSPKRGGECNTNNHLSYHDGIVSQERQCPKVLGLTGANAQI